MKGKSHTRKRSIDERRMSFMNDDKHLVIHFNNGTEMEVSLPTQIKNSLGALVEAAKRIQETESPGRTRSNRVRPTFEARDSSRSASSRMRGLSSQREARKHEQKRTETWNVCPFKH
jgi:hypothetical protein